ncbi:MAG: hypothetical protein H6594_10240 [Flavobacteriales bacterium]|nr:hypothetical protein [Flavobacteriales bacterium]
MAKADGADGVRFYLAKDAAGRYTAVAGPIDAAGMHVAETGADLKFWMYNGISSGAADMTMLNEDEAVGIVKASSTASRKAYCMQAGAEALREVLSTTVANGLGLVERKTADKMWTFDLVPVKMAGTTADQAGDITNMRVGAPCPNFCGSVPEYCLNMR